MNRQILGTALAVLCGGAMFGMPALAQQPTTGTQANTQAVAANQGEAHAKHAVPPLDSRMCIRDTGSHIPPAKGKCLPVAGNSYSQQDLQRTGATNVGQALQMLDPSVTVHGH